jgi:gamma-D-glutamyl-L-lysine dipeptidyl-peptidase
MSDVVVVRAAIAPMHAEARVSSVQISQRLGGHALRVLAMDGEWLRARGDDGYEGWVHRGYVEPADASDLARTDRRLSLSCVVRASAASPLRPLPLGAWVPTGDMVVSGYVIEAAARDQVFARDASAIAATAVHRFAGTPYQWGGVSPWGADCSGLVQTTFWLHGVVLPRDAWQQAETGRDAGADAAHWEAADLVFFSDREDQRITHVGIALGHSRMVHLALGRGGYAVERLDARDDSYVAALMTRFVGARRVL